MISDLAEDYQQQERGWRRL